MKNLLKADGRREIERINSKLYGSDYLATDLRNILKELSFLLDIDDAVIFVNYGDIERQEFCGNAQLYLDKYPEIIEEARMRAELMKSYVSVKSLSGEIKRLFVFPIKQKNKNMGSLIIFNKELDSNNDVGNNKIIKIFESQIKFAVKKSAERRKLFKIFERYVDKRQIFEILKDPDFLEKPRVIESVVLFADISGFTEFTNKSDSDFVFNFLGKILNECSGIVNKHNGVVDKFVGDQIIGIFGIVDKGNMSENALKSAQEIRNFFKEFKEKKINIKISIVKGSMIYGNLGGEYKTDLTVIGKNVNFASRLCSHAKPGEILIGDKVYEKLKENYNFKVKELQKFKGFSEWNKFYQFVDKLN